ncbi:carboxylesterase/lipase family protein [Sphingomonas sp. SRS2]|uniref:carboxylesterase/lipase family protein n=1 Tax=Sphingomonas sp. SRS2 TaxID=133190 RepID=UPI000618427D|nr:carboxylesterase family protein [Sphingomonas sp. SRS2]KKC23846.1 carboxylesterase [Sphingomonas sp. SRS2]
MAEAIVTTTAGKVRGLSGHGVRRFFGIPYAAAPVAGLRFAPPEPQASWDGIRDAIVPGPNAPQRLKAFPGLDVEPLIGKGWMPGDDYLSLNVWTPDDERSGRPIMVWIHGGGFVIGSKDVSVSDCSSFARDGIVCFAINYRMGIDGFLPIPGIPTNLGLRDMIAALRWIHANAVAFGGDPTNLTVFGESAGAMAVADLMASPLAKGLFNRAIVQSGHGGMTRDIPVARRLVDKLAKMLKVTPDRAGFASVAPEHCFDAVEKISAPGARIDLRDAEGHEPVFGISRFVPVHGDDVLPQKPLDALRHGAGAEVDLLIGTNAEEMNLYLVPSGVRDKIWGWLASYALGKSLPRARRALKAYGLGKGKKPGQALTDAMNDLVFRWPARRFAEEHKGRTHMYEFDWRSPAFGGELGSCHGMELPFVFDTLATATGPEGLAGQAPPQALADRIHRIWVDFAVDGSLPWEPFDSERRLVYSVVADEARSEAPMPAANFLP